MSTRAQIVAPVGLSSENSEIFTSMVMAGVDVARLNFSWGNFEEKKQQIAMIREVEKKTGHRIPIIADLPGPRLQTGAVHTYDKTATTSFTQRDRDCVEFGVSQNIDYFALSFVGTADDVLQCKEAIKSFGGNQSVIAKIERANAVNLISEILEVADAVMIARGDLGKEVPIEEIPFVQVEIIKKAKLAGKPVITATGMLLSMTEHTEPTRAEVTDVNNAIMEGSDAVMLSEETASGKYPVEAVHAMEKIVTEAEKHSEDNAIFNSLK